MAGGRFTLAAGPNVNYGAVAGPAVYASIVQALAKAQAIVDAGSLSGVEATITARLLEALRTRYLPAGATLKEVAAEPERFHGDQAFNAGKSHAYAVQMLALSEAFPDDTMVGMLAVGALMQDPAWKWWRPGQDYLADHPRPSILDVSGGIQGSAATANRILQDVLKREPFNVGANHYYIHNVEAGPQPLWANAAADRLVSLEPSGHAQHMATHVFARTGRWSNDLEWNKRANAADVKWMLRRGGGLFASPLYGYEAHDVAFGIEGALHMHGWREATAHVQLQYQLATAYMAVSPQHAAHYGSTLANEYIVPLRFGLYAQLLRDLAASPVGTNGHGPAGHVLPSLLAARRFAESVAAARTGDLARSRGALARMLADEVASTPGGLGGLADGGRPCRGLDASGGGEGGDDGEGSTGVGGGGGGIGGVGANGAGLGRCVAAVCNSTLGRWATGKAKALSMADSGAGSGGGTLTVNNDLPLRCLNVLVPWADQLVQAEDYAAAEQGQWGCRVLPMKF